MQCKHSRNHNSPVHHLQICLTLLGKNWAACHCKLKPTAKPGTAEDSDQQSLLHGNHSIDVMGNLDVQKQPNLQEHHSNSSDLQGNFQAWDIFAPMACEEEDSTFTTMMLIPDASLMTGTSTCPPTRSLGPYQHHSRGWCSTICVLASTNLNGSGPMFLGPMSQLRSLELG